MRGECSPSLHTHCCSDPSQQPEQLWWEWQQAGLLSVKLNTCKGRTGQRSLSHGLPLAGTCWLQCVPGCREEAQPALAVSPHVLERMSHVLSAGHPLRQQPDPGQAGFMPDPSAALRCSLYCRALFFQLWARGWRISPAPHQHGQCLLGLLWVAFQVTGDQQRGTTAGRGNLHIRYPPCFLPEGKCFDQLAQSPVPDVGPSQASLAYIEGPGTGDRHSCSTGGGSRTLLCLPGQVCK